jgi:hypothetical protein
MRGRIVIAKPPKRNVVAVGSVELTHADRPLWPGIAKLNGIWRNMGWPSWSMRRPNWCAWEGSRRAVLALDRFLGASRRGQAPA